MLITRFAFAKKHIVAFAHYILSQHKFFPFLSPRKVAQAHTGKNKIRSQSSWIHEGMRNMETQKTENPRLTPQNLVRENTQETKKENNEIETPSKKCKT
jgi:hypothetical protein